MGEAVTGCDRPRADVTDLFQMRLVTLLGPWKAGFQPRKVNVTDLFLKLVNYCELSISFMDLGRAGRYQFLYGRFLRYKSVTDLSFLRSGRGRAGRA